MHSMKKYILTMIVLFQGTAWASSVTFFIRSMHPNIVSISFYSQNGNYAWPGGDKVWIIDDNRIHAYRLNCNYGEVICYGAWVRGNPDLYWGSGPGGIHSCSSCCLRCNGGEGRVTVLRP